jgi:hypothetical protein
MYTAGHMGTESELNLQLPQELQQFEQDKKTKSVIQKLLTVGSQATYAQE